MSAQLVEVPQGSVVWSRTIQAPVQDLFQLQDALTHAIVSSLHVPLAAREHHARRKDVPISAAAYELYLRGNQLMNDSARWADVRKLYEQALELDPGYAPAWARLGRMLRVMAKYSGTAAEGDRLKAERAFERALALNPDLSMAHHFYAHLEVEMGRATDAMVRLLTRARARGNDPELFAGLVTTCRYCGLLDESVAAFEAAQRLDPSVHTSVAYTFYVRGDYQRVIDTDSGSPPYAALLARYRLDPEGARPRSTETERLAMYEGVRLVAHDVSPRHGRRPRGPSSEAAGGPRQQLHRSRRLLSAGDLSLESRRLRRGARDPGSIGPGRLHLSGRDTRATRTGIPCATDRSSCGP